MNKHDMAMTNKSGQTVCLLCALALGLLEIAGCSGIPQPPPADEPPPAVILPPELRFLNPENDTVVSGSVLVRVTPEGQAAGDYVLRFEAEALESQPGQRSVLIAERSVRNGGFDGSLLDGLEAKWDTDSIPSGPYRLRAGVGSVETEEFNWFAGPMVDVNKPPQLVITVEGQVNAARREILVVLSALESSDPDGRIVEVNWQFEDGRAARGMTVERSLELRKESIGVSVVAIDDKGTPTYGEYDLQLAPEPLIFEKKSCVCESIVLRGDNLPAESAALGPDAAAGGTDWPKSAGFDDGKKLGPLDGNAENAAVGGEKNYTGYAFEILATVKGSPGLCKEGQLARSDEVLCHPSLTKPVCESSGGTWNAGTSCCSRGKPWRGKRVDLDKDGTDDIDVSTQAKCTAAGGKWLGAVLGCQLNFPKSGGYNTDTATGSTSNYDSPYTFKKRVGQKVVWYDTPALPGGFTNGSKVDVDFISYLRDSDGKYCYVKYNLIHERKAGKDSESASEKENKTRQATLPK